MRQTEAELLSFADLVDTFRPVDDRVMGGVSRSRMSRSPDGYGVFSGELSLENNGGFASVRASGLDLDLSDVEVLQLRVRGDGKQYKLRLHDDSRFDGVAFETVFETSTDEWVRVELPLDGFRPVWRGRLVADAPPLARDRIFAVGLMISNKQQGPFRLELGSLVGAQQTSSSR